MNSWSHPMLRMRSKLMRLRLLTYHHLKNKKRIWCYIFNYILLHVSKCFAFQLFTGLDSSVWEWPQIDNNLCLTVIECIILTLAFLPLTVQHFLKPLSGIFSPPSLSTPSPWPCCWLQQCSSCSTFQGTRGNYNWRAHSSTIKYNSL